MSIRTYRNARAKLTEQDVLSIRAMHREGITYKEIAKKFNCSETNVSKIITGKLWWYVREKDHGGL